jgi:hypothetical protein
VATILRLAFAILVGFAVFFILAPTSGAGARCFSSLFEFEVPCSGELAIAAGAAAALVVGIVFWRISRRRMA